AEACGHGRGTEDAGIRRGRDGGRDRVRRVLGDGRRRAADVARGIGDADADGVAALREGAAADAACNRVRLVAVAAGGDLSARGARRAADADAVGAVLVRVPGDGRAAARQV